MGDEPLVGGIKTRGESTGRTFPGEGGMSKFLASGGETSPIPPVEKTLLPP